MTDLDDDRAWAERLAVGTNPDLLVAALSAAGWVTVGGRPGLYVRLDRGDDGWRVTVPLDTTKGDYLDLFAAVLMELRWADQRGRLARQVLDQFCEGEVR